MVKPYEMWTLQELKAELRRRNARISGRKLDLLERLEAYDRNMNFGATVSNDVHQEFSMTLPAASQYRDLHAGMKVPILKMSNVERFLDSKEKKIDKKAITMYNDHYVNFIRFCSSDCGANFKAEIRTEMKLKVVYAVDLLVSLEGIILECQCECAAGMGPRAHCKHVCCILFGLTEFGATKSFKTLATCTQQLQTFHQAKKTSGVSSKG